MKKNYNFSSYQIIGIFLLGIFLGVILSLPVSSKADLSHSSFSQLRIKEELGNLSSSLENLLEKITNFFHKEVPNKPNQPEKKTTEEILKPEKKKTPEPKEEYQEKINYIPYERAIIEVVKKASPSVVSIIISKDVAILEKEYVNPFEEMIPEELKPFFNIQIPQYKEKGRRKEKVGGGSGFIVSKDGLIVTNKHVVALKDASYTVLTNNGKKYEAEVLFRDPTYDVAILKIKANNLPVLELGDSSKLVVGQTVIAIGNALGEFGNTVSVGVVSGLSRTIIASGDGFQERIQGVIQTDAAINKGNSGGPLLDLSGKVVGINTAMAAGAENIGFAIPINQVKDDINSVINQGKVAIPYLGIRYILVNENIKEKYNLPVDYGALIVSGDNLPGVFPYSPAQKAGLKEGDIVLKINNDKIDQDHPLNILIRKYKPGERVELTVMRGKSILHLKVVLGER